MDPKVSKAIVKALNEAVQGYRQAASDACQAQQPYEVYQLMKESFSLESKSRNLSRRYQQQVV